MNEFQRDALINKIVDIGKIDRNIFFLSADFGAPALDRLRAELPDQFLHLGISEQNLINVAIGLALKGKTVFTYAMAPFISLRCAEQHKIAAMMHLNIVNIIAGIGLGYANAGPTHYATEDLSVALKTIGSSVYTIADSQMASDFADHICRNPKFCFVRLDRDVLPSIGPRAEIGKGYRIIHQPRDVTVITHGYCINIANKALLDSGLSDQIGLIDLFQCKPIPTGLVEKIKDSSRVVIVDEQIKSASLASQLAPALFNSNYGFNLKLACLEERFMFENVGRANLVKIGGITEQEILKLCLD